MKLTFDFRDMGAIVLPLPQRDETEANADATEASADADGAD